MVAGWVLLSIILSCTQLIRSAPVDYFPINSQLPPVARISRPFSFVFSPLTFSSPDPISYTLVDPPSWLSIDSSDRRLFGTPEDQDIPSGEVVGIPISILAEDQSGSTTVNATLVVSRNPTPEVTIPLSEQITKFGRSSGPSSLSVKPSEQFRLTFDPRTFGETDLEYYGVSRDNTPLPSWLLFDPNSLSFSGNAPAFESLLQPPQKFDLKLIASDVVGFSSVLIPFSIIISVSELTVDSPVVILQARRGNAFRYSNLTQIIKLDGRPVAATNISSISTNNLPLWLNFDDRTWELSGMPTQSDSTSNVTVIIVDKFSNEVKVTLVIDIDTEIFRSDIHPLNVSAGTEVLVDIKPYLWNSSDVELKIYSGPKTSWVHFDASRLALLGTAPTSSSALDAEVNLKATSKTTQETESRRLLIHITAAQPRSLSRIPTAPTSIRTDSPPSQLPKDLDTQKTPNDTLLLAILLPLFLVFIILIVSLFCFRRRRRNRDHNHVIEVSAPIPGTFVKHDASSLEGAALHGLFDMGSRYREAASRSGSIGAAATSSRSKGSGISNLSLRNNLNLYVMPLKLARIRPAKATTKAHAQPFPASPSLSPGTQPDEGSLLSDTSIATEGNGIQGAMPALVMGRLSAANGETLRKSPALSVPMAQEPFSIQATPEVAYIAGGNSSGSDDELDKMSPICPSASSSMIQGLGIQPTGGSVLHGRNRRVSNAWKRGSPSRLLEEYKRKTDQSNSTDQTTRTSFLTAGAFEDPVTANIISRPTVVHIPSRPGDGRHGSRRVHESSPLFGGGSVVRSPKNFGVVTGTPPEPSPDELAQPPLTLASDTAKYRERDSPAKPTARNSLGIAYQDIISNDRESEDLMSPDRWPRPNVDGIATPGPSSRQPQLSSISSGPVPTTPIKSKRKMNPGATNESSPSTVSKRRNALSREERLRMSRAREQQALNSFKALMSHPEPAWPYPEPRPLPETPTRMPLADRPNESRSGGPASRTNVHRKLDKSTRGECTEADDSWEDVVPEPTPGGELFGSSTGSFPVFI
ncbi:uncharacterized protein JN550_008124 [Neoarthrinium moseri]|uniref:uncharacterized protein n=1 Tax=Neoarthrinium moseri TaxID=1658444 RepID=UPI001FDE931C|nr:uncharacterized protein JN550_008124 [Neoarthrinium moseri]KAI1865866.1 hypothetical protein JN550_008124 [Neoarthrinium moseri]